MGNASSACARGGGDNGGDNAAAVGGNDRCRQTMPHLGTSGVHRRQRRLSKTESAVSHSFCHALPNAGIYLRAVERRLCLTGVQTHRQKNVPTFDCRRAAGG